MSALNLVVKPQEFFREKVATAAQNQNVQIDDEVEFYLVNLLCDFIAPGKLETLSGEVDPIDTPLALMLKEALESPPAERVKIFKYLGDCSLYFSGFFQEYFNRKCFDIGYYIEIGANAYENVAAAMCDALGEDHATPVYRHLSNRFSQLVEIVAEVSDVPGEAKPTDLLAAYERWTHTNSSRLKRLLEREGITPIPTNLRKAQ